MNTFLKIFFTIATLTLLSNCKEKLSEPVSFFENYDLSSGKYKIKVYALGGEHIEDFKNFYIDDIETLKTMKKQWIFKYKSDVMPCGYGYGLNLITNNKIVKKTLINIDCEYMEGWIHFPKEYLKDHKNHFKRMN